MNPSLRTILAGLAGGLAFVLGTFMTFRLLGGAQEGRQGLLFDPETQSAKVIAVWKEIEPLPRITETPLLILGGLLLLGIAYAVLYRALSPGWPAGTHRRAVRMALVIWLGGVFAELMGPFNVLHSPLALSALSVLFWAVCAVLEGYAIVLVSGQGAS
ncbi:hypothetical protein [Nocardioides sp. YIM 152315]|uniref:hypothetical protein n=1 Tax=Nocardioides sp. YIM 152315 TaxID=3031760 RepID=UPI0023D9E9FC|nr:hypothetical protein [Nocardioides sp. YIM 152315]MDF1602469.1 hypothetical protein [Nocardioides sp. YIM 152315]